MVKHLRKELQSHLSGSATFVEDLNVSDQLHVAFLRSPFAHARIRGIDKARASGSDDVVRVFTRSDLKGLIRPDLWREFPLAETEVVYQGQAVAAVASSGRLALEDLHERITVDYEPLPVVSESKGAIGTNLWLSTASSNVVLRKESVAGRPAEALRRAPHTLSLRLHLPRISPYPLEGRGVVIERGPKGTVVYSSTQSPAQLQRFLRSSTLMPEPVRVIQTAVGGAFGGKIFPCAEDLACYLISGRLRRNVKWIPPPEEKLETLTHRPDQTHDVRVGYDGSGRILALRDHVTIDAGAYFGGLAGASLKEPGRGIEHGSTAIDQMVSMSTGPYGIKDVEVKVTAFATNKVMMGPIRGSGGMVATFVLERVLNQIALRLGLDQFSVRKANLIAGESRASLNPFGITIPPLRFADLLETARGARATRELIRRASLGGERDLTGYGLSFYIAESAPPSAETVKLELTKSGKLVLYVGVAPTGQGSERTLAAIVSRKLRSRSPIEVRFGDTRTSHHGLGTLSSRSITYAGSAALLACKLLVDRIKDLLGSPGPGAPTSIAFGAGLFQLRYGNDSVRNLDLCDVPAELGHGVAVEATYESETPTFSSGCHISLVKVDGSTGAIEVASHLTFDDFGRVLDKAALTAQTEGGVLQSIGEALYEEVNYDRGGRLNASYLIPSAPSTPTFFHTPVRLTTSQHLHGARGAGEAGRIGSLPAIVNAIENALSKSGRNVFLDSIPVTAESAYGLLYK